MISVHGMNGIMVPTLDTSAVCYLRKPWWLGFTVVDKSARFSLGQALCVFRVYTKQRMLINKTVIHMVPFRSWLCCDQPLQLQPFSSMLKSEMQSSLDKRVVTNTYKKSQLHWELIQSKSAISNKMHFHERGDFLFTNIYLNNICLGREGLSSLVRLFRF